MPRRERYQISLRCPKCGNSGTATVEENGIPSALLGRLEHLISGRRDQEIVSISADFRKSGKTKIVCARCFNTVPLLT